MWWDTFAPHKIKNTAPLPKPGKQVSAYLAISSAKMS
jgi:hypothetical protein